MYTVDYFRERYSRTANSSLLSLLRIDPERLMPEARVALADETERRGLRRGDGARPLPVASEPGPASLDRAPAPFYPKVKLEDRLAAWIFDAMVGAGPLISAAVLGSVFNLGQQSRTTQAINMFATSAWAIYYAFTKDARPNGQSIGKKLCNLMVIDVETCEPCSLGQSIGRNLIPAFFSMIPVVGWLVEPIAVCSADGRRLGDRAARTQVIDVDVYESLQARLPPGPNVTA